MKRSAIFSHALFIVFSCSIGPVAFADDYINESRTFTAPTTTSDRFTFSIQTTSPYPNYELRIRMSQGRAQMRVLDPHGRSIQQLGAQDCMLPLRPIPRADIAGTYTVEIATDQAVGQWQLRICGGPAPPKPPLGPGIAGTAGMMLVAGVSVWFWLSRSGAQWRWFWMGALLWTVAIAAKIVMALPLILDAMRDALPRWAYLVVGGIYGGFTTGVTEVLFTFIAALIWRQLAADATRGVAIGVGAGAFEAVLLAVALAISTAIGMGVPSSWSLAIAPVVERVIAIWCHVAARALVLLAVARRRWSLFWYGFLLLSGIDAIVTVMQLAGGFSIWTMELLIAPFGLISIPITIWCVRQWPARVESSNH